MSRVVQLRPAPKKDRTAAKRARRYRKRKRNAGRDASAANIVTPIITPTVTESVTPAVTVERTPVDLIALRREIWEWVENHHAADRSHAVERRQRIKDRIAQLTFLLLGVAFFVLLAFAAVS